MNGKPQPAPAPLPRPSRAQTGTGAVNSPSGRDGYKTAHPPNDLPYTGAKPRTPSKERVIPHSPRNRFTRRRERANPP
jgi:hypothetical protein